MAFSGARRALIRRPMVISHGPTQLPLLSNLAFKLSADSITGLSNGASLTTSSWVDSQNAIAVDGIGGTAPTFEVNVVGTKPSVRFAGNGGMTISTPGALKTAVDSQTYTVLIACKTNGGGGVGGLNGVFGASAGGNSFFYYSDTANAGPYDGDGAPNTATFSGASFFSMGRIANAVASTGITAYLNMLNGTSYYTTALASPGSGGNTFSVGTAFASNPTLFPYTGDVFEILVWNVALTPAQYMQAEMWLRDKYAQPYPWAPLSKIPVFFGDSIAAGVGATTTGNPESPVLQTPTYLAAQTNLGLTYGQYQSLAIPGISMNQMTALVSTYVNPIAEQIGKKIGVICFEWANQRDSTTTAGAAMLAALKAMPNVQTVFGTSTDASQAGYEGTARDTYDAAWAAIAAGASTNIDSFMPIHTDAHVGVDGSYALYSSAGDGVHLVNATYPYLAALMSAGFSALPP
jgi:hypothetical protein